MDLVRDLLDKLVVDRNGREIGRVDRIVLEQRDAAPMRVAGIEIGPAVLASRLHPALGRAVAAVEYALGIGEDRPMRVGLGEIIEVDDVVRIDTTFGETPAAGVEGRVRRWITKIPRLS